MKANPDTSGRSLQQQVKRWLGLTALQGNQLFDFDPFESFDAASYSIGENEEPVTTTEAIDTLERLKRTGCVNWQRNQECY